MKKLFFAVSITLFSVVLTGCGVRNTVDTTANYVNTGVGYVVTPVANTVGGGVKLLTGYPASSQDRMVYQKKGVVYKNGHTYTISNGRYVLVR